MFDRGSQVSNPRFGRGEVILHQGPTVVVRFAHGIEECETAELAPVDSVWQVLSQPEWHAPLEVITRILGEAIRSVNDAWGVFSRSRVTLLPHQLWVCHQVNRTYPTRWMVADDVGLGKTIEAGLILLPLLSRNLVRRLLVLCPASLVEQWQYRLRTMFDIRLMAYTPDADTPKADFWNTQHQVVASLHTLRLDRKGRHQRLMEADPWDMVVVDEAHHLNADEEAGPTLGYKLVDSLQRANRIGSMVFFTGTPHRGKNYGFLALLRLLRPDLFDPRCPLEEQLPHLKQVMIRNHKHNVTDLSGQRLFHEPVVQAMTYAYSPAETCFYQTLTEFILTGKAYAQTLNQTEGRAVMLVLIAMQKLASSSVAAIRRALHGRLQRITAGRRQLTELEEQLRRYREEEAAGDTDATAALEEQIAELSAQVVLMTDEEPRLRELVAAAAAVTEETKVRKVLDILDGPFVQRSVLLFTEYKATQSLFLSKLLQRHGADCATFINGDGRADDVVDDTGRTRSLVESRERAAERFNAGSVRFLVSTEAGGEGIDLQQNCHSLVHIDLPWNPMRLHQRVGRLNRYGQSRRVDVFMVRNPDTVESRIWDKLNEKLHHIMRALSRVMPEPEDLLNLVLGMTSPALFREVFADASGVPRDSLADWFDTKTRQFGGQDVLATVNALVGSCARFDFQQVSPLIPRVDLPDLKPFFKAMLMLNKRKVQDNADGLSFLIPDAWADFPGAKREYKNLVFSRTGTDAQRVLGVGHRLVDNALTQACSSPATVAAIPDTVLDHPLYVFMLTDRVTTTSEQVRSVVVMIEARPEGYAMLRDKDAIHHLNHILAGKPLRRFKGTTFCDASSIQRDLDNASRWVTEQLPILNLPFRVPCVRFHSLLLPSEILLLETDTTEAS